MAAGRARRTRPRRVSLPGVHELLRPSGPGPASDSGRPASGREAHSQKITVYLSVDELIDLERARLTLRGRGISVDRGRLVREAIAVLLADLESGVDTSVVARRLLAAGSAVNGSAPVTGAVPVAGVLPVAGPVVVTDPVPVAGVLPVAGAVAVTDPVPVTGAAEVIGAVPGSAASPVPGGAGLSLPGGAMPVAGAGPVASLPAVGLPAEAL